MNKSGYEDILEARRNELANWSWSSRALKTQVAVKIVPRPTPQSHKLAVLQSPKIVECIQQLSIKKNVKKEEVEKQILEILEEIGYTKSLKVIRYLSYMLTKAFLNACSGIYVNYEGLLKIKANMGGCPVIFVPSHRSYADFIVFSYVCYYYDIEIPAIAAGMDFHGMMGVGEMLRNTGAFFMRRSYSNDDLYWTIFKEYIYQLVCKGDLPIEFFIEGTRSRSNKSMSPKYGLINMILKAYFLSQVPDTLFVPVSISYDRILEEKPFAFELLGVPKSPESTSGFFKSLSIIKERFGNMYFHFGEPISTRDFLEPVLDRTKHSFGPLHLHEINEEEKQVVPYLAYEIVRRQQLNSVLSYFNLIALILNNNVTRGQVKISRAELIKDLSVLRTALTSWGATIFEQDLNDVVKECLVVHQNLVQSSNDGSIELVTTKIEVGRLDPSKLKAHALSAETISYSVPFVMLQIYANPVLHYLVDGAIITVVLKSLGKMNKDNLFKHYCTLRALFAFEFVLLETWYRMNFEEALSKLNMEKIITNQNDDYALFENRYFEEVLINSLQPFILSYYVVTEVLQNLPESVEEKTILASAQKLLEEAINERKIFIHPYCMSLDSLNNCLNGLNKAKVVKKSRANGKNVYQVDINAVRKLKSDLEIYIPSFSVIESFQIFQHIQSKL